MLTEHEGCAILKEAFLAAGYDIADNVPFSEGDIQFNIDGFDAAARVGFEFITTEAGDRNELTPEMIAAVEKAIEKGALFLLLVDEEEIDAEDDLRNHARRFLDRVAERRRGAGVSR